MSNAIVSGQHTTTPLLDTGDSFSEANKFMYNENPERTRSKVTVALNSRHEIASHSEIHSRCLRILKKIFNLRSKGKTN